VKRLVFTLLLLAASGCATITPMQTASVVDPGHLRLSGQLAGTGFCGDFRSGLVGAVSCSDYPDGFPIPEVRVNGRYGAAHGFDVGLSLQAYGQVQAPQRVLQVGATLDVKRELLRVKTDSGLVHVISAGLLGSASVSGRVKETAWSQLEWGVPVFYGLQFAHFELVANATLITRHVTIPAPSPTVDTVRVSFALGLYRRDPSGFGVQIGWLAEPAKFSTGAIMLSAGWFFDVL
jgi:hypothetical protein